MDRSRHGKIQNGHLKGAYDYGLIVRTEYYKNEQCFYGEEDGLVNCRSDIYNVAD
jgi:hypothetical protein